MRFDRFITLNLVQPIRRSLCHLRSINPRSPTPSGFIPILMYHSISNDSEVSVGPYYKTNTSPAVFRRHMEFLRGEGYHTLSLEQALELQEHGLASFDGKDQASRPKPTEPSISPAFPSRCVVVTFDDGYRDFYTEAFPALREHGFSATMFLPTSLIQNPRRSFKGKECMTWDEVRELDKAGMHFGSHTVTHPKLVELSWPEIRSEVSESKSQIEQQLGHPATTFAYPFAFPQMDKQFVLNFTTELREAGYQCCATTEVGRLKAGDNPYRLKRLPVNSLDDPSLFRAKLDGSYDWLAAPQAWIKQLKRRARPFRESRTLNTVEPRSNLN